MSEAGLEPLGPQPSLTALYRGMFTEKASSAFWGKYLYTPMQKEEPRAYALTSGNLIGRATYAASCILVTRDDSGRERLNTSYFLGVLASVAIHTSHRPYWARSASATFNDFGSTIGGDAGINVFHAFEPDIRQIVRGHTPKFVSRIEERVTRGLNPRDVVSIPAR
jgi:hypothetical protein